MDEEEKKKSFIDISGGKMSTLMTRGLSDSLNRPDVLLTGRLAPKIEPVQ